MVVWKVDLMADWKEMMLAEMKVDLMAGRMDICLADMMADLKVAYLADLLAYRKDVMLAVM